MRVLIGCEESQRVCLAFRLLGHEAYSCDLQDCSGGHPEWHIKGDVVDAIENGGPWDIIIIHLDCTCITVAGNGTYGEGKPKHQQRIDAIEWTVETWNKAKKHAIVGAAFENPINVVPNKRLGTVQYIHPWQYGHPEQKKTCIYRDRLPALIGTNNVYDHMMTLPKKEREACFYMSPGPDRGKNRSKTYPGWADAMALQWGRN